MCDSLCRGVVELVFPGAAEAGLNAAVLPQPLDDAGQLARHEAFLGRAGQHKQLPRVVLQDKNHIASQRYAAIIVRRGLLPS